MKSRHCRQIMQLQQASEQDLYLSREARDTIRQSVVRHPLPGVAADTKDRRPGGRSDPLP